MEYRHANLFVSFPHLLQHFGGCTDIFLSREAMAGRLQLRETIIFLYADSKNKNLKKFGSITRNDKTSLKQMKCPFLMGNWSMWAFTFLRYTQLDLEVAGSISNSSVQNLPVRSLFIWSVYWKVPQKQAWEENMLSGEKPKVLTS